MFILVGEGHRERLQLYVDCMVEYFSSNGYDMFFAIVRMCYKNAFHDQEVILLFDDSAWMNFVQNLDLRYLYV